MENEELQESGAKPNEGEGEGTKTFTQDDINAILAKERGKWQKQRDADVKSAAETAAKKATMTAEEKAKFERDEDEKEYRKRLEAVTKRELAADAKAELAGRGLPIELAELLNYTDKDACTASLESVAAAFAAAVEKNVDTKLKASGGAPKTGKAEGQSGVESAFYKMNPRLRK